MLKREMVENVLLVDIASERYPAISYEHNRTVNMVITHWQMQYTRFPMEFHIISLANEPFAFSIEAISQ